MLPKTLRVSKVHTSDVYGDDAWAFESKNAELAAELVRRWNAFEAMGEALGLMSRAYHSEGNTRDQKSAHTAVRNAYALYLRPENNATLRGQNVDETA